MMFNPEMMKLAQEQLSKMSPGDLAKMQQQMMSNPELIKMATESMKSLSPEDMRNAAEQLKYARPEDMAEISEKMAKSTPEEIAAMRTRADAHFTYELKGAEMIKQQGNSLHSQGKYGEAAQKYLLVKKNLKSVPVSKSRKLQLACSLNLMSCYLKTKQYEDCIKEGSEVLAYEPKNVKALYRRGQAYKELGWLEAAVADLGKANSVSPDDETIADALREASEQLSRAGGSPNLSQGITIEEITEEDIQPMPSEFSNALPTEYSVRQPQDIGEYSDSQGGSDTQGPSSSSKCLQGQKDNLEAASFHNFISNADPEALAALSAGGMSPDMVKAASDMISGMSPEEIQRMLEMASSLDGKIPASTGDGHNSTARLQTMGMSPDMIKTASDTIRKMSPEELKKMFDMAASMNGKDLPFSMPPDFNSQASQTGSLSGTHASGTSRVPSTTESSDLGDRSYPGLFQDSLTSLSSMNPSTSAASLQEQMRNQMKDPAMRQMFSSMIKNMSPDMMANMSEQFGVKLSREEAAKAQQAMSSISPEDLDRMMRWADRIQKGIDGARKTKNWLLGRAGMILAICMLILAIILQRLGFIGG